MRLSAIGLFCPFLLLPLLLPLQPPLHHRASSPRCARLKAGYIFFLSEISTFCVSHVYTLTMKLLSIIQFLRDWWLSACQIKAQYFFLWEDHKNHLHYSMTLFCLVLWTADDVRTDPLNICFSKCSYSKLYFSACTSWIMKCIYSNRYYLISSRPEVMIREDHSENKKNKCLQNIINTSSSWELVTPWLIPGGEPLLPHRNHQRRLCWLVTKQNALSSLHYFSSPQTPLPPLMEFSSLLLLHGVYPT